MLYLHEINQIRPGRLDAFLRAVEQDYLPLADTLGIRNVGYWTVPPGHGSWPETIAVWELDGYDQVVGARTTEEGTKKAFRVPAKWFIRKLAEYLANTRIPDLNSGFRAFRKPVAEQFLHLLPTGFSCVTTITMSFLANGYTVKYVPIDYAKRAGSSKFHWRKDTSRYLVQVVRLVLSYNPLRFFGPVGGLLAVVGFVKLGFDLADQDWRVSTNTLLIIFAAFQVLVIGLLADLVVRVTRPRDEVIGASS